jgi:hypothetical protein
LLKNPKFIKVMHRMMRKLEDTIGHPVEVEFAYQDGKIYILQCRAFSQFDEPDHVDIPESMAPERTLFRLQAGLHLGRSARCGIHHICGPQGYCELPSYDHRLKVARLVGFLNDKLKGQALCDDRSGPLGFQQSGFGGQGGLCGDQPLTHADRDRLDRQRGSSGRLIRHPFLPRPGGEQDHPLAVQTGNGQVYNAEYFQQKTPVPPEWAEEFEDLESCVKLMHVPSLSKGKSCR